MDDRELVDSKNKEDDKELKMKQENAVAVQYSCNLKQETLPNSTDTQKFVKSEPAPVSDLNKDVKPYVKIEKAIQYSWNLKQEHLEPNNEEQCYKVALDLGLIVSNT